MSNAKDKRPCALRQRACGIVWAIENAAKRLRLLVSDAHETDFIGDSEARQASLIMDDVLIQAIALGEWVTRAMNRGK